MSLGKLIDVTENPVMVDFIAFLKQEAKAAAEKQDFLSQEPILTPVRPRRVRRVTKIRPWVWWATAFCALSSVFLAEVDLIRERQQAMFLSQYEYTQDQYVDLKENSTDDNLLLARN